MRARLPLPLVLPPRSGGAIARQRAGPLGSRLWHAGRRTFWNWRPWMLQEMWRRTGKTISHSARHCQWRGSGMIRNKKSCITIEHLFSVFFLLHVILDRNLLNRLNRLRDMCPFVYFKNRDPDQVRMNLTSFAAGQRCRFGFAGKIRNDQSARMGWVDESEAQPQLLQMKPWREAERGKTRYCFGTRMGPAHERLFRKFWVRGQNKKSHHLTL